MLADRLSRIGPSPALAVVQAADRLRRAGVDVADLSIGEPDFATPIHVRAAAHEAIDAGFTKYTANAGMAELRAAIVARYREDFGVEYGEAEAIVTAGGKQALFNAMLALVGPGDEVITHAPGWPTIPEQVRLAEATPVVVRAHADEQFALRAEAFIDAITPRTRAIVINSPCNPTGAVITEEALAEVAEAAAVKGIWVVLDLCYERIVFDGRAHNLARVLDRRVRDRMVLAGSASKAYAMTGWRCGWAIAPAPVIAACDAIQSHSTSNVSSVSQRAALAALTGPQACVAQMRDEYRQRRDLVMGWLARDPRLRCHAPGGAFYLFLDIGDLLSPSGLRTSAEFAQALLDEAHVAVMAGEAFDAPGFLRLSLATARNGLRTGVERLHAFVAALERDGRLRGANR
jgi:aspartate aminotransferase